ncbi:nicotinate-nucleotide--dimethylbenzimidazole phosphoribosyltransferase [Chthonomonas calidirosea]|uniref:nicotinate-nucleotide--dimethylbenzimidazole phosphoribosyltransferase n=1 Tax=Chthonomonas calidirosea TaxID=454171 RepID=UPI0006EC6C22|nr:nicotinate-nucleotide--dimethylbenzimidazole phosphoribosyltransferase [Chthonomonas calidirosea]CEK14944.1 nicotinate-nucleotide-dimethylbenzimidazole phosphoribosyltransferase [Chthonomonas calidirosea]
MELKLPEIPELSRQHRLAAQEQLDRKTKPVGSLGRLEELAVQLCAIQHKVPPDTARKRILVFAADHGITEEKVSAYPREVTAQMLANFAAGGAAINVLARLMGGELFVVDVGVAAEPVVGVKNRKVRWGTRNFAHEPAMTVEETLQALNVGIELAFEAAEDEVDILCLGEMGIGNTTAAAALLCLLTEAREEQVVGRGTGLTDAQLEHKRAVVARAVARHREWVKTPFEALCAVGGLEIAALVGSMIGAAASKIPVIVDGFIVTVAALVAYYLTPKARDALIFAHRSEELGHRYALELLEANPLLDLGMRLGEGSGAALASFLVEAAGRILREMATFAEAGVSEREEQDVT